MTGGDEATSERRRNLAQQESETDAVAALADELVCYMRTHTHADRKWAREKLYVRTNLIIEKATTVRFPFVDFCCLQRKQKMLYNTNRDRF